MIPLQFAVELNFEGVRVQIRSGMEQRLLGLGVQVPRGRLGIAAAHARLRA
jgi:hypothetical protein